MGFNSNQLGDGNITNVVIKSRYTLLDLKCNALEKQLKRFMKKIVKIVLDEINDVHNTNFTFKDVYFVFDREIITNALDNAQIEQYKANTKQIEINTLLNVASKLDDETLVQNICEILDIDYELIEDKLPKENLVDLNQATKDLEDGEDE